jgi:hypothetical protein
VIITYYEDVFREADTRDRYKHRLLRGGEGTDFFLAYVSKYNFQKDEEDEGLADV